MYTALIAALLFSSWRTRLAYRAFKFAEKEPKGPTILQARTLEAGYVAVGLCIVILLWGSILSLLGLP